MFDRGHIKITSSLSLSCLEHSLQGNVGSPFLLLLFLFIITYTSTNYTKLKKIKKYIKLYTYKN